MGCLAGMCDCDIRPPMDISVNNLRDLYDSALSSVQRLKKIVQDEESENSRLQVELNECKAHISEFRKVMLRLTMCCDLEEYESMACELMTKTPKQSLVDIQAKTINDLISEKSVSANVDGCATSVIYICDAEAYANKLSALIKENDTD